jgi:hypothetical protein
MAVVLAAGSVAAGVALVRYAAAPKSLPGKVGQLACEGGKTSQRSLSTRHPGADVYPDLLREADSAVLVSCSDFGPSSVVVKFSSPAVRQSTFDASRTASRSKWCLVGAGAFDGPGLAQPTQLARFCRRLGGKLWPERS